MLKFMVDDNNKIINLFDTDIISDNLKPYYPWLKLGDIYTDTPSLEYLKNEAINRAGTEFAKRRDAIRWVDGYGYDCANEDITNFLVRKDAVKRLTDIWDGVGPKPTVLYKVWIGKTDKKMVALTLENFERVQDVVSESQIKDYLWYEEIKEKINSAKSKEDLENIFPIGDVYVNS